MTCEAPLKTMAMTGDDVIEWTSSLSTGGPSHFLGNAGEWTSLQPKNCQITSFMQFLTLYSLGFFFSFEVKHPGKICQLVGVRNHSIFGCRLKSGLPTENTSIVGIPWVNVNETGNVTVNVTVNETNKTIGSGGVRKPGKCCSVPGKMCCFLTKDMGKLYLKVFGR